MQTGKKGKPLASKVTTKRTKWEKVVDGRKNVKLFSKK